MLSKSIATLLVSTCFGFSTLALASNGVMTAQTANLVKIESVSYKVQQVDATTNMIQITAVGEFGNSCMAPQKDGELATAVQLSDDQTTDTISLIQLSSDRICPTIESPVHVTIQVGPIYYRTGGMNTPIPNVIVNSVKATP